VPDTGWTRDGEHDRQVVAAGNRDRDDRGENLDEVRLGPAFDMTIDQQVRRPLLGTGRASCMHGAGASIETSMAENLSSA
jgi:hypothetical protein